MLRFFSCFSRKCVLPCMFCSFRCYFSLGLDFSGFLLLIGLPFFFAFLWHWVQLSSLIYLDFWQLSLYLCWGFPRLFPAWFLADLWSMLHVYFFAVRIFFMYPCLLAMSLQFRVIYLIFRTLSRFSFGKTNSRWQYHFCSDVRAFPAFWDSSNFSKHPNFGPHSFTQWFKTLWIKW